MGRQVIPAREKGRDALLGIRLTTALKIRVKVEAARRGLTVAQLFEEIWQSYIEQEHVKAR